MTIGPSSAALRRVSRESSGTTTSSRSRFPALRPNARHTSFDADLAVPLETAEKFIRLLRDAKADIVIGTRKTKEAIITRRQPWYREFLGKGFSRLTNIMLGTSHTDITCGFKAFNAPAAAKIFGTQKIDGWGFDAEILFLARRFGLHVIEVPVTWRDDPDSKVHVMRDILKSLAELIRIRLLYL
jgi:dolichyl-phosphate beta-glucosyltransferase